MSAVPLPARILIPVANPATAEELISLGANLLEPRSGELTALGIVEVPEGMALSEGATRARHAAIAAELGNEGLVVARLRLVGAHRAGGRAGSAGSLSGAVMESPRANRHDRAALRDESEPHVTSIAKQAVAF